MDYTNKDWKDFLRAYGLNNRKVAGIIGLTPDSVKNQTAPSKKLPAWAIAFIYSWKENVKVLK